MSRLDGRLLGVAATIALAASARSLPLAQAPASRPTMVVAQVPAASPGRDALAGGTLRTPLGNGGRLVLVDASGRARVLTAAFDSAADPDVSFDGKTLLFAGRKVSADPWCAWEMNVDGTGLRKITCGAAGVRQPIYQATIYTLTPTDVEPWVQIAFVGENPGERNEAMVAPNTSLWSCKTDGSALRRLTFNLSNDMDPVILPDGRMVYAGWLRQPSRERPEGRVALLGVNEDGTDYQTYAGDQGLRVKQMPAPTSGGLVAFIEANEIGGDGSGRLATVSQARPLHSYRSLSGDGDGRFRAPAPLPDGRVLVAWRPALSEGLFGVYRVDLGTGSREKLFEQPGWHAVQAKAIAARPAPDARSSVVRDDDPLGKLYTIDVGIDDLGPAKRPDQTAKTLRVVEGVAATADHQAARRLLGEVPIAEDGSFQVQVPANTPVSLELLNADGVAVRTSTWLWVRNHAAQGCVGCHEDPERVPPNRLMKALASPAPVLNPPPAERRAMPADSKPAPSSKCMACHAEGHGLRTHPGGLP